jgi:hypothetical protein
MRTTRSNTLGSLLAAVGAGFAAAAIVGAPAAVADDNTIACEPGQIVIDGNCAAAPVDAAPADPNAGADPYVGGDPNAGGDPFAGADPNSGVDLGGGGFDPGSGGLDIGAPGGHH